MEIPEIVFSKWNRWNARSTSNCINYPGVYILAHFNTDPLEDKATLVKDIIYIGITGKCTRNSINSKKLTLENRLDTFHKVAFDRTQNNHSGGKAYRNNFPHKNGNDLYFSIFPIKASNKILLSTYIQFVERKLIYEYVMSWNDLPMCNNE